MILSIQNVPSPKNIFETIAVLSTGHKKLIFQTGRFTTNQQKVARITPERWTDSGGGAGLKKMAKSSQI